MFEAIGKIIIYIKLESLELEYHNILYFWIMQNETFI